MLRWVLFEDFSQFAFILRNFLEVSLLDEGNFDLILKPLIHILQVYGLTLSLLVELLDESFILNETIWYAVGNSNDFLHCPIFALILPALHLHLDKTLELPQKLLEVIQILIASE